ETVTREIPIRTSGQAHGCAPESRPALVCAGAIRGDERDLRVRWKTKRFPCARIDERPCAALRESAQLDDPVAFRYALRHVQLDGLAVLARRGQRRVDRGAGVDDDEVT